MNRLELLEKAIERGLEAVGDGTILSIRADAGLDYFAIVDASLEDESFLVSPSRIPRVEVYFVTPDGEERVHVEEWDHVD